ncbi:MAG: VWA domain-containing protein [Clostridia bacterium]|nr:VWA domain-containing protein [Clostridia bacterium]
MVMNQGLDYNVDIVMCIDATGSMHAIIDEVKSNALSFYKKFVAAMEEKEKGVNQLRMKVIAFRDFGCDTDAMLESDFFILSGDENDQSDEFHAFVNGIVADGGGDLPENSLEALALAMQSDWVRTGSVRRHVIMMYTDAQALPLGARSSARNYPDGMPADLAELHEWWEGQAMERRAKRLLLFAPDTEPWSDMIEWQNTFHQASQAGKGCSDTDMAACIHMLVNSI